MRRLLFLLVCSLALASVAVASSGSAREAQSRWVMTDLGTLGGRWSEAYDVNERGQVVGAAGGKQTHGFMWSNGKMRDLGRFVPLDPLEGRAINDRGQILGDCGLWADGRVIRLGSLGAGTTYASALNDRGQVAGRSRLRNGHDHAFLWQNGELRDLGTLGGPDSRASAINNRGQVVGSADTRSTDDHAFLWQSGKMRDLGTLGGPQSYGLAINDRGQVVGVSDTKARDSTGDPISHAFLWQRGNMKDLGPGSASAVNERGDVLIEVESRAVWSVWHSGRGRRIGKPGGSLTDSYAINDRGEVVGYSQSWHRGGGGAFHAFVWRDGKMTDLGARRSATDSTANGLNEHGQIVGAMPFCWDPRDCDLPRAVLWTLER